MVQRKRSGSLAGAMLLICAAVQGCAGHEHAPAAVPADRPFTTAGDRFDVVVPRNTPVSIIASRQDPDEEAFRAFRYDWVVPGQPAQGGQRQAGDGPLTLAAVPARGFLYLDGMHRLADDGANDAGASTPGGEQKSSLRWKRLGEGVWRLFFRDGRIGPRRDDLVVTVRFLGRQASTPAAAAAPPPEATPTTRQASGGRRDVAVTPPLPTWGEKELGRPLNLNPCRVCRTTEHLARRVTDTGQWYWVRCNKCNRARMAQDSPDSAEQVWNTDNPLPGSPPARTTPPR